MCPKLQKGVLCAGQFVLPHLPLPGIPEDITLFVLGPVFLSLYFYLAPRLVNHFNPFICQCPAHFLPFIFKCPALFITPFFHLTLGLPEGGVNNLTGALSVLCLNLQFNISVMYHTSLSYRLYISLIEICTRFINNYDSPKQLE